jgi:hypothetical protein
MNAKNFLTTISLSIVLGGAALAPRATASTSVSVSFFYGSLAPYGEWVTVGHYGRCWRPHHVAAGWQPYLYGEWIYTDAGWTWVSYDPWGGDPYHYGTWVVAADYGWVWLPGTVWAPAWVTWYVADDYCGWAPVPPSFSVGVSGYVGPPVTVARSAYVFVPTARLAGTDPSTVRVPPAQNAALASRAQAVTRFAPSRGVLTAGGPSVAAVERARGSSLPREAIARAKTNPVPLAASAHGRAAVVAPAAERARVLVPRAESANRHGVPPANGAPPAKAVAPAPKHVAQPERHPAPAARKAPPPVPPLVRAEKHTEQPRKAPPAAHVAPPPPRHVAPAVKKAPPPQRNAAPQPVRNVSPPPHQAPAPHVNQAPPHPQPAQTAKAHGETKVQPKHEGKPEPRE